MKKLILVGAGHAHLAVLSQLAQQREPQVNVVLVCKERYHYYSGLVPAWIAGHTTLSSLKIDIARLCKAAEVQWVQANLDGMNASRNCIWTEQNSYNYDILSINTGADSKCISLDQTFGSQLISVRPLSQFVIQWPKILAQAVTQAHFQLAIVGAGAAAVELAMAAQVALKKISNQHRVTLVCGEKLLPNFHVSQVRRVRQQLSKLGIRVEQHSAICINHDALLLSNRQSLTIDFAIGATGSSAPKWTASSQLNCNKNGFILVGATHQSISHANVFAVGDICERIDQNVARSGVHAVYAGRFLAKNLPAYARGQHLRPYHAKTRSLYLLACGKPYAIACWGKLVVAGFWIWWLKQLIDHHFVKSYQN